MKLGLPLVLRLFLREWRGGELGLLLIALMLGVSIVTGIDLFAQRLQKALVGEASSYLGADRVLQVSDPVPAAWLDKARLSDVRIAQTTVFPTMVYPAATGADNERSALASLKAVTASYPLRGDLEVRDAAGVTRTVQHGPAAGTVWVDANLLHQLDIALGSTVEIGRSRFLVDHVLTREGDAGSSFYGMGMRVMINADDLPATQLLLPGSRAEYRYLFAGGDESLNHYFDWLSPQLPSSARLITLHDNQPGIAEALNKANLFLRLAGSLGVLLAALAAAFAAQRYCQRHTDAIAVLKTLGAGKRQILHLLAGQMAVLWLMATLLGFLPGILLEQVFLYLMRSWIPAALPTAGWHPFALGALTSLICLSAFIWPTYLRLVAVPPWHALRSATHDNQPLLAPWLALPGVALLLLLYSQNLKLTGLLLAGGFALLLPTALVGSALLHGGRGISQKAGSIWRLGIANVMRRRWLSLLQILVFSIGFMLLSVMVLLRSSLLQEWKLQIPADAPNVFLINIAPTDVESLRADLLRIQLAPAEIYPMVRGRLTRINGVLATDLFDESVNAVYRELNLSWSTTLPIDNNIIQGTWPGTTTNNGALPVSVEQGLARRLHLTLGDALVFTVGGTTINAHVASIRSLDWDKMTPNFYFLFPPDTLSRVSEHSATWMTSLYRSETQESALAQVLRRYPSISAYPIDDLLARIQTIVQRVSFAVETILWLVLSAGLLVLLACLRASIDQRLHESALLRTLGAGKRVILGSLMVEFAFIGLTAGILAASGAEITIWALQTLVFKMSFNAHAGLWIATPIVATLLVAGVGCFFCRRVLHTPPVLILREHQQFT